MKIIRILATDYAVLPSLQCDLLHRKGQRVLNDLKRAKLSCGSYDSAPHPSPSLSPVSNMSLFLSLPVCRWSSLLRGGGGSVGRGSNNRKKAWPSVNHSILSGKREL
jgi:hypothetical protein